MLAKSSRLARSARQPRVTVVGDVVGAGASEMDAGVDVHRRIGRGHEGLERRPAPRTPATNAASTGDRGTQGARRTALARAPSPAPPRDRHHAIGNARAPRQQTAATRPPARIVPVRASRTPAIDAAASPHQSAAKRSTPLPSAARQPSMPAITSRSEKARSTQHERGLSHSGHGCSKSDSAMSHALACRPTPGAISIADLGADLRTWRRAPSGSDWRDSA